MSNTHEYSLTSLLNELQSCSSKPSTKQNNSIAAENLNSAYKKYQQDEHAMTTLQNNKNAALLTKTRKTLLQHGYLTEELYEYLSNNKQITGSYQNFIDKCTLYNTPYSIYTSLQMDEFDKQQMMNRLMDLTIQQLAGYQNALDWWVQNQPYVQYVPKYGTYIVTQDHHYTVKKPQ